MGYEMTVLSDLTPSQKNALDVFENDTCNAFLTGYAGTGKSFLVSKFLAGKDQRHEFPVLGSTGVAALLIGGRTFHSFFGLGYAQGSIEDTIRQACGNKQVGYRLRKAKTIIIDEVSMISGHLLTAADMIARHFLDAGQPWGGLRVIVVGDFAQLPPVEKENTNLGRSCPPPGKKANLFRWFFKKTFERKKTSLSES